MNLSMICVLGVPAAFGIAAVALVDDWQQSDAAARRRYWEARYRAIEEYASRSYGLAQDMIDGKRSLAAATDALDRLRRTTRYDPVKHLSVLFDLPIPRACLMGQLLRRVAVLVRDNPRGQQILNKLIEEYAAAYGPLPAMVLRDFVPEDVALVHTKRSHRQPANEKGSR